MIEKNTVLANNIRFLRKSRKLSQEELASLIKIKRSNIAAYESKNVEPRLRVILEIAKIFDVDVKMLIETRLNESIELKPYITENFTEDIDSNNTLELSNNEDVNTFISKSIKVRKILEGFKAFYTFKKTSIDTTKPDKEKLIYDIDNFIQLMEHLLTYNETVIKAISNAKGSNAN